MKLTQQAALKGTISLRGQEKRRDKKSRKSRSEEKVVSFSSASIFPSRKWEANFRGGPTGDRPPYAEDNPGRLYRQML